MSRQIRRKVFTHGSARRNCGLWRVGTFSKVFGIARFVASDALKILKMSGDEIFCDPSRSFNMAPFHVEWIAQGDEEFAVDYLKRAMLYARIMV